jgi:hypothetical protein
MMCGEAVLDARAGLSAVERDGAVGGGSAGDPGGSSPRGNSAGGSRGVVPPGQQTKESGCE